MGRASEPTTRRLAAEVARRYEQRDRESSRYLKSWNDAAARRQATESRFSPLLRALARQSGGWGVGPGSRQSEFEVQGNEPPRRVEKSEAIGRLFQAFRDEEGRDPTPSDKEFVKALEVLTGGGEPVTKSSDALRALGTDEVPEGWVVAYPEGTDPSRGGGGFYAIHRDAPDFPELARRLKR